jgi:hypothetical protein
MWDHSEPDDIGDDWKPLRQRRALAIRFLAIVVVAAMVLALVIPALLRLLRAGESDDTPTDGVRAGVVAEEPSVAPLT